MARRKRGKDLTDAQRMAYAQRKQRRLTEAERAAAEERRVRAPLVVEGISEETERWIIPPTDFDKLNVDDRTYQRVRTPMVSELIYVIKNGGSIFGHVAIAKRPNGSLWVVDGLQRFMAANECNVPLAADLYRSEGPEAEALLYQALNNKVNLNANNIVKSHQGPGASWLMKLVHEPDSPYYGNTNVGSGGRYAYGAFIVVKAMFCAASGRIPSGKASMVLARLDYAMRSEGSYDRVEGILALVPRVFPAVRPIKLLPALALGLVAYEQWHTHGVRFPTAKSWEAMKRINWESFAESAAVRYLPSVKAAILARWKT